MFFFIAGAVAFQANTLHHGIQHGGVSFIRSMDFKHHLRVCNAYPYEAGLDVVRAEDRLTSYPMAYKECKDFKVQLKAGDRLDFMVGNTSAGTFAVQELPQNDAVMMLVIHRHDTATTTAAFQSHVFANLLNAQVTTIDAYKGTTRGMMKIEDKPDGSGDRSEELRYNSVVAVNPGAYKVVLEENGHNKDSADLIAINRESYVVLRVGLEAQDGKSYPGEIVVFPKSDPSLVGSASSFSILTTLLLLMAW